MANISTAAADTIGARDLAEKLAFAHAARCSEDSDADTVERLSAFVRTQGFALLEPVALHTYDHCSAVIKGPDDAAVRVDARWSMVRTRGKRGAHTHSEGDEDANDDDGPAHPRLRVVAM